MRTTERSRTEAAGDAPRSRDVNIRAVLLFAFSLGAGLIAAGVAMLILFRALEKKGRAADRNLSPMVAASLARTPPEPRLEAYPLAPRARLRAEEDAVLTSYGWVDKDHGVVRLPIDRAMELLVERGLPPSKPMPAVAPAPVPAPAERTP
jgi:hypothetical protein